MGRGRGTPAGLSTALLRRAVLEVADAEGLDAVSVRNVARHLGVEAMSIYHWYPNKDALLTAVWDEVVCQLNPDALKAASSWQDYARGFAEQLRGQLLEHPNALPIMLGRHVSTLESMTVIDHIVAGLHDRGLSYATAVDVVNTLSTFTMAHALNEHTLPRRRTPPPDPVAHPSLCAANAEGIPNGPMIDTQHFQRDVTALITAIN